MAEAKKTTRTRKTAQTEGKQTAAPAAAPANDGETLEELREAYEAKLADMQAEMAKQIEAMKAMMEAAQKPQVIQMSADTEKVQFLWMAEVCDENIYEVGPGGMYGRIVGRGPSRFLVPKNDLSRAMDTMFRQLMDCRWIIVLSGMTDEERKVYGVDYREGEYLDEMAFTRMVSLGDKILDIYPALCDGHKEMVEKRYYEAWKQSDPNVTRELVGKLKNLAFDAGRSDNAFKRILQEMNAAEAED